jgi:hypothetical protein
MIRVAAIEKKLPDDVRRTIKDHPLLALTAGALAGYYLGRGYGKEILTALVGVGISAGASNARRMLGVPPPDSRRR